MTTDPKANTRRDTFIALRDGAPGHARLLTFYDACGPVAIDDFTGCWHGGAWATGTRFDGLLERLDWYGKTFRGAEDVDALLFRRPTTWLGWLNYALIWPFRLPERPELVRHPLGRARLRERCYRGVTSAAMCYRYLPIVDHFRHIDEHTVIGLMDLLGRPDCALFFWLERDPLPATSPKAPLGKLADPVPPV